MSRLLKWLLILALLPFALYTLLWIAGALLVGYAVVTMP